MCLFVLLLPFVALFLLVVGLQVVVTLVAAFWPWLVVAIIVWLLWRVVFGSKKK
jgi:Kef-type K+ transport system membrane component KefB